MDEIRQRFASATYSDHVLERMFERGFYPQDLAEAIADPRAEEIETFPLHAQGPRVLVLGRTTSGRPLHLLLGTRGRLCVITVYDPSEEPSRWSPDYRTRVSQPKGGP